MTLLVFWKVALKATGGLAEAGAATTSAAAAKHHPPPAPFAIGTSSCFPPFCHGEDPFPPSRAREQRKRKRKAINSLAARRSWPPRYPCTREHVPPCHH